MLENFKRFPLVARIIFCLQLLVCISSMLGAINILKVTNDQVSMFYMLAGGDAPSKITLYMTILSTILVILSILLVFFSTTKHSILIYFVVLVFNLVMGVMVNGYGAFSLATNLVLILSMAYVLMENRYLFLS